MRLISALGLLVCTYCFLSVSTALIDVRFLLIATVTIVFGSRLGIDFSSHKIQITVSDTFIFLTLLLYGMELAVLLAGAEAFYSSLRFSRLWRTRFFNAGLLAVSTFVTGTITAAVFGPIPALSEGPLSGDFITAICLIGGLQYVINSCLAARRESFKLNLPFLETWKSHFLWTSITYFAGASAAGVTSKLVHSNGYYAFLALAPILAIIYFTYQSYRKQLQATLAQAEQAQRHAEEQRAISQELRQSEEQFRSSFDNAAIGMALVVAERKMARRQPFVMRDAWLQRTGIAGSGHAISYAPGAIGRTPGADLSPHSRRNWQFNS